MAIEIRPFSAEWRAALREFNGRLDAAGVFAGMRLPEDVQAEMLPGSQLYIAVEEGAVRAGFVLRPQQFSIRGAVHRVTHYRLPLSEGLIQKRYATLAPMMLRSAIKVEPLLYALGMGGRQQPLPRMLEAMGWSVTSVPFFFRVVHPARFLRGIRAARSSPWRAAAMDLAAWTGAGWMALKTWQAMHTQHLPEPARSKEVEEFSAWADGIWEATHRSYGMTAVRDSATLGRLYPSSHPRFNRLQAGAGWAVILDTAMHDDPYFGNLRVGTIADCLASLDDARTVIHAARVELEHRGVDLIISNQGHIAWQSALRADGFLEGPSNFLLGASPALAKLAGPISEAHINRGDGDGPVHL
ncbi:MAG: hypothetical protein C5B51_27540 [Terriglobia bacterium]|nr:MAG: hypothetical protein C5B51_27540 [Terriglobia bacterium]